MRVCSARKPAPARKASATGETALLPGATFPKPEVVNTRSTSAVSPGPRSNARHPPRWSAAEIGVWCLIAILLSWLGPAVFEAVELGLDEHFELTKGLLWARGVSLYHPLWNDQPPLLTVLLGVCFQVFGPGIVVARTVALAFGLALLAGAGLMIRYTAGPLASALAVGCLLSAPMVLILAASTMLEVPAMGTALWALWPILRCRQTRAIPETGGVFAEEAWPRIGNALPNRGADHWRTVTLPPWCWLMLSGVALAVALQIKLTAAIAAPALASELLFGRDAAGRVPRWRERLRGIGLWSVSLAGAYAVIGVLAGQVPSEVLWASHFSQAVRAATADAPALPYWPGLWTDYGEALCGAGISLLVLGWQRQWRTLRFPLVWLLTAALVHAAHRPYWSMYNLHFAVPLAWLMGCGIAALFRLAESKLAERAVAARQSGRLFVAGGSVLLAALVTYGGERLWSEGTRIRQLPRVAESALVAAMRQYANDTHWVYTRETIYPFHAGLLVVPELAVLPSKRFWSGEITDEQVWATVRRYRPEQLLLTDAELELGSRAFVAAHYRSVYRDGALTLYVSRTLGTEQNSGTNCDW